jgi:hypothetical protein
MAPTAGASSGSGQLAGRFNACPSGATASDEMLNVIPDAT